MNSSKFERFRKLREEFEQISVQTYEDWSKVESWFRKAKPTIQTEWSEFFSDFQNLIRRSRFWTYEYSSYKPITHFQRADKRIKLAQASQRDAEESIKAKQEILDLFEGLLRLETNNPTSENKELDSFVKLNSKKVFVVHGRDNEAKLEVARFLEKLDLEAVILHEQANRNKTIIEKLEHYSDVAFAVVLLTPDDVRALKGDEKNLKSRARQNVIFELGYMIAKLQRKNVCALMKNDVEKPTDYDGVLYISMDDNGAWKQKLVRELKAAEIDGSFEKLYS